MLSLKLGKSSTDAAGHSSYPTSWNADPSWHRTPNLRSSPISTGRYTHGAQTMGRGCWGDTTNQHIITKWIPHLIYRLTRNPSLHTVAIAGWQRSDLHLCVHWGSAYRSREIELLLLASCDCRLTTGRSAPKSPHVDRLQVSWNGNLAPGWHRLSADNASKQSSTSVHTNNSSKMNHQHALKCRA